MIFPYRSVIAEAADGGDFFLLRRPEIPIVIEGPTQSGTYLGLVDTGSDHTIVPMSIARYLGVTVHPEAGPPAVVFGGQRVHLAVGEVSFTLQSTEEVIRWTTEVCFFEFPDLSDETLILGHSSFLDYFRAVFDGKSGTLSLDPNDDLPTTE